MIITNRQTGVDFFVRVVFKGDKYGRDRCLTHNHDAPMLEFYDFEYAGKPGFDNCGQFVSRYNVRQIADITPGQGLCLNGGIPRWEIDGEAMRPVISTALRLANMHEWAQADIMDRKK